MKFNLRSFALTIVVSVCCFCAYSFAGSVTFTLGDHPQPGEENVLFQSDQMGTMISGFTNASHTEVDFSSNGTDTLFGHGGQSKISVVGGDGLINDIIFMVPGHTFTDAIFNAFMPVNDNDLVVTVTEADGDVDQFTYGSAHGSNFLTIVDPEGAGISQIEITSAGGFSELTQVRVSGISGVTPTPEPSSLLLLGSGLACIAGFVRRRM